MMTQPFTYKYGKTFTVNLHFAVNIRLGLAHFSTPRGGRFKKNSFLCTRNALQSVIFFLCFNFQKTATRFICCDVRIN